MTYTIPLSLTNLNPRFFQHKKKHHFHLVPNSQLPLVTALASMLFVFNGVFYLHLLNQMAIQNAWIFFSTELWNNDVVFTSTMYSSLIFFRFSFDSNKQKTYLFSHNLEYTKTCQMSHKADKYSYTNWNEIMAQPAYYHLTGQSHENEGAIRGEARPENETDKKKRFFEQIPYLAEKNASWRHQQHLRKKYDWFWKNPRSSYVVFGLCLLLVVFFFNLISSVLIWHSFNLIQFVFSTWDKYPNFCFWIFWGSLLGGIFLVWWGRHNIGKWRVENDSLKVLANESRQKIQNQINQIPPSNMEQENRALDQIYQKLAAEHTTLWRKEDVWVETRSKWWWHWHDPMLIFSMVCLFVLTILLVTNVLWYGISPNAMYAFWKSVWW